MVNCTSQVIRVHPHHIIFLSPLYTIPISCTWTWRPQRLAVYLQVRSTARGCQVHRQNRMLLAQKLPRLSHIRHLYDSLIIIIITASAAFLYLLVDFHRGIGMASEWKYTSNRLWTCVS